MVIGILVLEENIFKGLKIYGHGGHFGHVIENIRNKLLYPYPKKLRSIGPVVPEEKVFENVDGWPTEDDRKTDAGVIGILLAHL